MLLIVLSMFRSSVRNSRAILRPVAMLSLVIPVAISTIPTRTATAVAALQSRIAGVTSPTAIDRVLVLLIILNSAAFAHRVAIAINDAAMIATATIQSAIAEARFHHPHGDAVAVAGGLLLRIARLVVVRVVQFVSGFATVFAAAAAASFPIAAGIENGHFFLASLLLVAVLFLVVDLAPALLATLVLLAGQELEQRRGRDHFHCGHERSLN